MRTVLPRTGIAAFLCMATFVAGHPAWAAAQDREATESFRNSFSMSFYAFDWCGDNAIGALYRRAIRDKLDRCPFSAAAKERFHAWSDDEAKQADQAIRSYLADHSGKLPERVEGMKVSCAESLQSGDAVKFRRTLERYGKGEASVDSVIPDCGTKAEQK